MQDFRELDSLAEINRLRIQGTIGKFHEQIDD